MHIGCTNKYNSAKNPQYCKTESVHLDTVKYMASVRNKMER